MLICHFYCQTKLIVIYILCRNRTVIEVVMIIMCEELDSSMITIDTKVSN